MVTGELYAALATAFPGGLPSWLSGPRCGTGTAGALNLTPEQHRVLADLVALAWWEHLQADEAEPFTSRFVHVCAAFLGEHAAFP